MQQIPGPDGEPTRFCQLCGRFHHISAFDNNKRSCRERLARHNERRKRRIAREAAMAKGLPPWPQGEGATGTTNRDLKGEPCSPHKGEERGWGASIPEMLDDQLATPVDAKMQLQQQLQQVPDLGLGMLPPCSVHPASMGSVSLGNACLGRLLETLPPTAAMSAALDMRLGQPPHLPGLMPLSGSSSLLAATATGVDQQPDLVFVPFPQLPSPGALQFPSGLDSVAGMAGGLQPLLQLHPGHPQQQHASTPAAAFAMMQGLQSAFPGDAASAFAVGRTFLAGPSASTVPMRRPSSWPLTRDPKLQRQDNYPSMLTSLAPAIASCGADGTSGAMAGPSAFQPFCASTIGRSGSRCDIASGISVDAPVADAPTVGGMLVLDLFDPHAQQLGLRSGSSAAEPHSQASAPKASQGTAGAATDVPCRSSSAGALSAQLQTCPHPGEALQLSHIRVLGENHTLETLWENIQVAPPHLDVHTSTCNELATGTGAGVGTGTGALADAYLLRLPMGAPPARESGSGPGAPGGLLP